MEENASHTPTDNLAEDPAAAAEAQRRRNVFWVTLILLIGLPIYLILASYIVGSLTAPIPGADGAPPERPLHWVIEMAIYLILGLVWAWPLKRLVMGLGKSPHR